MRYRRMPIEVESPEQLGYATIAHNLSESSVTDRRLGDLGLDLDLDELVLCYGDHLGDLALRAAIAAPDELDPDDVVVTPGAAAALFCVATSLVGPGDHLVVERSNYATNLETPRAIGADLTTVDLSFGRRWRLDVDEVAAAIRPGVTRLISVTTPHNPTGVALHEADLHRLVALAEDCGAVLLVDETYRDLTHDPASLTPLAATLSPRVISVSSMSKAYGLPGLRVGWMVTRSPELRELLLAAKEQIVICGATLDEHIAGRVLAAREHVLPPILADVRERLSTVEAWMDGQDVFEWVRPDGGVVGFVRFRPEVAVDAPDFHRRLLADHGTYVGPGHWFEDSDRSFRLGFGWPSRADLAAGLAALGACAAQR